ncbi:hypothetical protein D3C72_1348530 [compost metagenome]
MHGLGQETKRSHGRAFDDAQRAVAVHHVQQFVAPAAQAVGLAQQFGRLFQDLVQRLAGRHAVADAQRRVVRIDARRAAQRIAGGVRGPAAAAARYI